jgi:hypothetical protein
VEWTLKPQFPGVKGKDPLHYQFLDKIQLPQEVIIIYQGPPLLRESLYLLYPSYHYRAYHAALREVQTIMVRLGQQRITTPCQRRQDQPQDYQGGKPESPQGR